MFMSLPHYVLTNQSQLKRMILDTTEYSSCQLFMFPKLFKKTHSNLQLFDKMVKNLYKLNTTLHVALYTKVVTYFFLFTSSSRKIVFIAYMCNKKYLINYLSHMDNLPDSNKYS